MRPHVRHRQVFYLPGFNPMPPRRYRELFGKESAKQATISGYKISQSIGDGALGWKAEALMDDQRVTTEFAVLYWSDIVRSSMNFGGARTYVLVAQTAWTYASSGALWRLAKLRKGPVITALYPVATLIVQLISALAIGFGLWGWIDGYTGAIVGLVVAYCALEGIRRLDRRFFHII